ncbi:hypothetical protein BIY24_04820 [Halobacteriovorax marinus]|uniref:Uncharacterized protein n=1 Tax=Halobacteriovorax marinus (strain ATCC BAA-682 / DSM 15412 / SJ) TaxID=862908 RepID=E1WXU9_HALMS|nr:hypothetical protein [Halobacteriovorax marinus]ATH07281.1 hypothetical protein BIY24_04820 [Halobacteriovorax marinus]CBW25906.1 hypothetical protein BMS_1022 [Halobacteriovorax marinus SJ]
MLAAKELTLENWTFVHYKTQQYKAFISMGASPKTQEIQYFVTVTDNENQEIFQSSHSVLEDALSDINKRYGHWSIFDAENPPESDGCSSCSAH